MKAVKVLVKTNDEEIVLTPEEYKIETRYQAEGSTTRYKTVVDAQKREKYEKICNLLDNRGRGWNTAKSMANKLVNEPELFAQIQEILNPAPLKD